MCPEMCPEMCPVMCPIMCPKKKTCKKPAVPENVPGNFGKPCCVANTMFSYVSLMYQGLTEKQAMPLAMPCGPFLIRFTMLLKLLWHVKNDDHPVPENCFAVFTIKRNGFAVPGKRNCRVRKFDMLCPKMCPVMCPKIVWGGFPRVSIRLA